MIVCEGFEERVEISGFNVKIVNKFLSMGKSNSFFEKLSEKRCFALNKVYLNSLLAGT